MAHASLPDPELLASRILRRERAAVASGLNLLDNRLAEARMRAVRLLACLSGERWLNEGHLIGVTGPPGAGKSSLVSAMIREWRASGRTVGVLAVDPSSRPELGGGALLGDRIRIKTPLNDDGLFIRSLANRNQLGGVASEVWPMSWLMLVCFDVVVIETVGVGQTEIDIAEIGDTVCYVAQPASGDTIQYLKSGIIEIPDIFAVNKADLGAPARKTASEIARSARRQDRRDDWDYPVCLVSATMTTGIRSFHDHFDRHRRYLVDSGLLGRLRLRHQSAWVVRLIREEFGTFGLDLAGGRAAVERRLSESRCNQFEEYERMRTHMLSRLLSVNQTTL
ncbi:methylmalonyl Co-A mutase-associated GTPase MeaB [Accumulibacter sp.]|uniref:ArgK/MeaB family GTPase n=1 Tax=Accumulibacter sp. TaxID=2053492 RepID=UPI0025DAC796|nr:methylmalonyl Co-A mutase-associated GTPase MeaB [Accumulibacter sp.]MCM8624368.1 methylmalonyl Co-A mutase-associated GTPase MeaB [Accumulibacter sp.]